MHEEDDLTLARCSKDLHSYEQGEEEEQANLIAQYDSNIADGRQKIDFLVENAEQSFGRRGERMDGLEIPRGTGCPQRKGCPQGKECSWESR